MPSAADEPRRRRILLVEDEYLIAADLETYLTSGGFEVVGPVATLKEAEALADSASLDAAVLDLNLRGQPVFSAARRLLERRIPFVLVSGYADPELPAWMPAVEQFSKPVSPARIVARLHELT